MYTNTIVLLIALDYRRRWDEERTNHFAKQDQEFMIKIDVFRKEQGRRENNRSEKFVARGVLVDKKYFDIQNKKVSLDNDRLLDHIICQDVINIVMYAAFVLANVLPADNKYILHICVNSLASRNDCREMQQGYIDEYNENLMLTAKLAKKGQMVKKTIFNEVVLRCSRLENHNVNLELKLQHQKENFLPNKPLNNQNAPEIPEIFKINEWQARLNAKDVSIAN
ncbi:hypothetical protein Tco_1193592 [Tanacetum coccineum]